MNPSGQTRPLIGRFLPGFLDKGYHVERFHLTSKCPGITEIVETGPCEIMVINYVLEASVHADTERANLRIRSLGSTTFEVEGGGRGSRTVPDKELRALDFAKGDTKKEVGLLRTWFQYMKDKHYTGQKWLLNPLEVEY